MKAETTAEVAKSTPPITIAAVATVQGWNMQDWLAAATIAYILLQALYLAWKWWREYRTTTPK